MLRVIALTTILELVLQLIRQLVLWETVFAEKNLTRHEHLVLIPAFNCVVSIQTTLNYYTYPTVIHLANDGYYFAAKSKPFKVNFVTDGTEAAVVAPALVMVPADTNNVGFCLDYQERAN